MGPLLPKEGVNKSQEMKIAILHSRDSIIAKESMLDSSVKKKKFSPIFKEILSHPVPILPISFNSMLKSQEENSAVIEGLRGKITT